MAFTEDEAKALLMDLVKRPDVPTDNIGTMYKDLITFHNEVFPAVAAEPPKKKKRKRGGTSKVTGWPSGVNRNEYNAWKAQKQGKGITEGLNPHAYKAERDGTPLPEGTAAPAKPKPATAAPAAKTETKKDDAKATPAAKPADAKAADPKPAAKPAEPKAAPAEPVAAK